MKFNKKEMLSCGLSSLPIFFFLFVIFLPTVDLLTEPISDETGILVQQTIESYLKDVDVDGEYIYLLLLSWVLVIMIGMWLTMMYVGYLFQKLVDMIWRERKWA